MEKQVYINYIHSYIVYRSVFTSSYCIYLLILYLLFIRNIGKQYKRASKKLRKKRVPYNDSSEHSAKPESVATASKAAKLKVFVDITKLKIPVNKKSLKVLVVKNNLS